MADDENDENDETSGDEGGIGGALRDMADMFGLGGVVDSAAEAVDVFVDGDADHDGLSNRDEVFIHQTDPLDWDTDADGSLDSTEVRFGTDPLVPAREEQAEQRANFTAEQQATWDRLGGQSTSRDEEPPSDSPAPPDDTSHGEGWWKASDGEWYSPERHPDYTEADGGGVTDALRDVAGVFGLGGLVDSAAEAVDEFVDADADGDSLTNLEEVFVHGTDPTKFDTDGDLVDDGIEVRLLASDPLDGDDQGPDHRLRGEEASSDPITGLSDWVGEKIDDLSELGRNVAAGAEKLLSDGDLDGDGLSGGLEDSLGTDPANADTDGDGVDDGREVARGSNPFADEGAENSWPTRASRTDPDLDGLSTAVEYDLGTDPFDADTDDDGAPDGHEVAYGSDPLDAESIDLLTKRDRLFNMRQSLKEDRDKAESGTPEQKASASGAGMAPPDDGPTVEDASPTADPLDEPRKGTVPAEGAAAERLELLIDSDGDGIADEAEELFGTDPMLADTDYDGVDDGTAAIAASGAEFERFGMDRDHDGLLDAAEELLGTDPNNSDTDGDSIPDLVEVRMGFDPTVADETPVDTSDLSTDWLSEEILVGAERTRMALEDRMKTRDSEDPVLDESVLDEPVESVLDATIEVEPDPFATIDNATDSLMVDTDFAEATDLEPPADNMEDLDGGFDDVSQ
jgi:hypothetical protein